MDWLAKSAGQAVYNVGFEDLDSDDMVGVGYLVKVMQNCM